MEEGYIPPLTIGKIYETTVLPEEYFDTWIEDMNYKVINDNGFVSWELIENFILLEQWRQQQINKIIE
jgi:hypothetical protein